ncbi:MAG: GldG family protein, partial [Pseudomonadales bacterium]|nr:GldG family protein [Pseudomonadales bacterium]
MKAMMQSKVGLMFVLVAFLVIVVVSSVSLKGGRIDLTENNLYTLSDGSKNIVQNLEQSVKLTLYFSDKATKELPAVRTYAQRVKELLQEYQSLSRGKIEFQVVDPAPFSEEEDAASAAGLQGVPAGLRGDEIYFGLVGESVAGGESS